MVRDINPGSTSASPVFLRVLGGSLYFFANDGVHGNEVWKLSPPLATATGFNVDTPAVTVTFNEAGAVASAPVTYTVQNLSGGGTFSPLNVSYDSPSRAATFSLPTNL